MSKVTISYNTVFVLLPEPEEGLDFESYLYNRDIASRPDELKVGSRVTTLDGETYECVDSKLFAPISLYITDLTLHLYFKKVDNEQN